MTEAAEKEIIKEAAVAIEDDAPTVIFVCSGNTCRSPMAAAVFNGDYKYTGYKADSAGLAADFASPMSINAEKALLCAGYKAENHKSKPISREILMSAKLVVGMTSGHAMNLLMRYPEFANKITCLPNDITDPFGGSLEVYKKCLVQIKAALSDFVSTKLGGI